MLCIEFGDIHPNIFDQSEARFLLIVTCTFMYHCTKISRINTELRGRIGVICLNASHYIIYTCICIIPLQQTVV